MSYARAHQTHKGNCPAGLDGALPGDSPRVLPRSSSLPSSVILECGSLLPLLRCHSHLSNNSCAATVSTVKSGGEPPHSKIVGAPTLIRDVVVHIGAGTTRRAAVARGAGESVSFAPPPLGKGSSQLSVDSSQSKRFPCAVPAKAGIPNSTGTRSPSSDVRNWRECWRRIRRGGFPKWNDWSYQREGGTPLFLRM